MDWIPAGERDSAKDFFSRWCCVMSDRCWRVRVCLSYCRAARVIFGLGLGSKRLNVTYEFSLD